MLRNFLQIQVTKCLVFCISVLCFTSFAESVKLDTHLTPERVTLDERGVYQGLSSIKEAKFLQKIWQDSTCDDAKQGLKQILEGQSMEEKLPVKLLILAFKTGKFPKNAQDQYDKYGFIPAPKERSEKMSALLGLNPGEYDFPLNMTIIDKSGGKKGLTDKFVTLNCLTCHSGLRANQVIVGAANHHLNPDAFSDLLKDFRTISSVSLNIPFEFTSLERQEILKEEKFLDRFAIPTWDSQTVPSHSRGLNYGPFMDGLMLVQREQKNPQYPFQVNYSPLTPEYLAFIKDGPTPTQPYPWYVGGRENLYRFVENFSEKLPVNESETSKKKRVFPSFTNFRVPNDLGNNPTPKEINQAKEDTKSLIHSTGEIWKLFSCLDAPPYPGKINLKLANKGCRKYNTMSCSRCHGTIKESASGGWEIGSYTPSVRNVGTDPLHRSGAKSLVEGYKAQRTPEGIAQTNLLLDQLDPNSLYTYEKVSVGHFKGPANGYQPRPLTALWSRAPYGHNAIFPNVETLMTPAENRPQYYKMGSPTSYDFEKMGVPWEPLGQKQYENYVVQAQKGHFDRTYLVNTHEKGRSNQGHSNPEQIVPNPEDRKALIECFKVLNP